MKTKLAVTGGATQTFVDDVFSTYLYTGNGSTQTITNGIDLAGKGGLVWVKSRNTAENNALWACNLFGDQYLKSNNTDVIQSSGMTYLSNGFTAEAGFTYLNASGNTYASWTFRKAAKFFDVVTWTGDGVNGRAIPHNLGIAPGMFFIKRTDNADDWYVYHRSLNSNYWLVLNSSAAQVNVGSAWTTVSSTSFTVPSGIPFNASGGSYVAYLFAHDTSSTGIIQCGSFTTDGSGNATVNLGWEPQWLLVKNADGTSYNWVLMDTMRGWTANTASSEASLYPNTSGAENVQSFGSPTATGFNASGWYAGQKIIYMAIRRPNKPPTSGTQVFSPNASSSATGTQITTDFPVDWQLYKFRGYSNDWYGIDRLRGTSSTTTSESAQRLTTNATYAEYAANIARYWTNTGYQMPSNAGGYNIAFYNFKRAPGFFDVVCWSGGGTWPANHNLSVSPELIIIKSRTFSSNWYVCVKGTYGYEVLQTTAAATNTSQPAIDVIGGAGTLAQASATLFDVSNFGLNTGVAYLFATLAGISKVGSYTGNGTGQAIACGFSAGARFVLIKRTDSTGDWYTFDSARGLTSGSSPYLLLNSIAAETTGNNGVYASTGGFTLGSTASTTTNINGASYIYLSVA